MTDHKRRKEKVRSANATDYEVGYKKPPREHQIKPGEVRAGRGRPRKALFTLETAKRSMLATFERVREVTMNGVTMKMTMFQATVEVLMSKPTSTAMRDLKALTFAAEWATSGDDGEPVSDPIDYTAQLRAKLDAIVANREAAKERERLEIEREAGEKAEKPDKGRLSSGH